MGIIRSFFANRVDNVRHNVAAMADNLDAVYENVAAFRGASSPHPRCRGSIDPMLLGIFISLIAFGVVMVFSSSAVLASQRYGDGHFLLVRQALFAAVSIPIMLVAAHFDYHRLRPWTYPFLAFATLLLAYIAVGFGHRAGGAARWISVGPFHIQPAEIAKLTMILWLAYSLSKKRDTIRTFNVGVLPHLLVAGVLALLCLRQPDFGSAVMLVVMTLVMLFAAGAKIGPIVTLVLGGGTAAILLILSSPMRMRRIEGFLDPFGHRQGSGYHVVESMLAFGTGGWGGIGIGDSRQKLFFLPEAHTDFISAIVGEELGFIGISGLVFAYGSIVILGARAALRAVDEYGTFLATGITVFIGLQAFTNLAVAMGMVPTKGLVLPFVSYGGSALIMNAAAAGVLLNVTRPREEVGSPRPAGKQSDASPSSGARFDSARGAL